MTQGFGSAKERKALLENTFSNLKSKIMHLNETSTHLEKKSQCMMIAPSKAWIYSMCKARIIRATMRLIIKRKKRVKLTALINQRRFYVIIFLWSGKIARSIANRPQSDII